MMGRRHRQRAIITSTLAQRLVFARLALFYCWIWKCHWKYNMLQLKYLTIFFFSTSVKFRSVPTYSQKTELILHTVSWSRSKLTLSSLNLQLSSHPLQAPNCCHNSRLVVDEDDLKWVKLVNQLQGNFHHKTPSCRKIKSIYSDVKWCLNASWGLKTILFPLFKGYVTLS